MMNTPCGESDAPFSDADLPTMPGGYVEEMLHLDDRDLAYWRPSEPDGVLAIPEIAERFERTGDAPYWTHVWPSAHTMARVVNRAEWRGGTRILELGCGVGLVSLGAAAGSEAISPTGRKHGWSVAASDNQPEAIRVAVVNAARNNLVVEELLLDWRDPGTRQFDRVLGCDVIYDEDLQSPLLDVVSAMLAPNGEAWFADAGRLHAPLFMQRARVAGFEVRMFDEDDQPLTECQRDQYQLFKLSR